MTNRKRSLRIPIATKLILSFLLIIVITSAVFTVVGIQLINNRLFQPLPATANPRFLIYLEVSAKSHVVILPAAEAIPLGLP